MVFFPRQLSVLRVYRAEVTIEQEEYKKKKDIFFLKNEHLGF